MADEIKKTVDDYVYFLNEAMAIHAKKAVENLPFDRTELVEIVDITNRDKGQYIVWNGSARYVAISENKTYKIGTKVYVTIRNNDFTQQKEISGLYRGESSNDEEFYDYELPLSSYQQIEQIFTTEDDIEYSLLANYDKTHKLDKTPDYILIDTIQANGDLYKFLGVSAEFQAMVGENTEGDYGLQFIVVGTDKETNEPIRQSYYLRSSDNMIGNIYNFRSYIEQQALFNIEKWNVSTIEVYFFQGGNFKNGSGELITGLYPDGSVMEDNIYVKNISLYYGNDKPTSENAIVLYTTSGNTYNSKDADLYNLKDIRIDWKYTDLVNGDGSQKPVTITSISQAEDLGLENVNIHWYKNISESDFTYQKESLKNLIAQYEADISILEHWDEWNKWIENNSPELEEDKMPEWTKDNALQLEEVQYIKENIFRNSIIYYNSDEELTSPEWFTSQGKDLLAQKLANDKSALGEENSGNGWKEIYNRSFKNNLAGKNWCLIDEDIFIKDGILPDFSSKSTKYQVIIEYGPWATKVNDWGNTEIIEGTYDTANPKYYRTPSETAVIEFINEGDVSNEAAKKNELAHFSFSDGLDGEYRVYDGNTGMIVSAEYANEIRTMEVVCESDTAGSYLSSTEDIVIWEVPIANTRSMIAVLPSELENNTILERDDDWFKRYSNSLSYNITNTYIKKDGVDKYQLKYQIAQAYRASATRNTITCYVIQKTGVIKVTQELLFSQFSYDGSDYMFTLNLGRLIRPIAKGTLNKKKGTFYADNEIWGTSGLNTVIAKDIGFKVVGEQDNVVTDYSQNVDNYYREIEIHLYDARNREIDLTSEEKNSIIEPWIHGQNFFYGNPNELKFLTVIESGENGETPFHTRVAVKYNRKNWFSDDTGVGWNNTYGVILDARYLKESDANDILYHQLLPIPIVQLGYKIAGPNVIVYDTSSNLSCMLPQNTAVKVSRWYERESAGENVRWEVEKQSIQDEIDRLAILQWTSQESAEQLKKKKELFKTKELEHEKKLEEIAKQCAVTIDSSNSTLESRYEVEGKVQVDKEFSARYLKLAENGIIRPSETFKQNDEHPQIGVSLRYNNYGYSIAFPIAVVQNKFNVPGIMGWFDTLLVADDNSLYNTKLNDDKAIQYAAASSLKTDKEGNVSGVLIGTVADSEDRIKSTESGLFGFDAGETVFRIGTDGEAFLGKDGTGRIYFSGNEGTIESANWQKTNGITGLQLHLTENSLKMFNEDDKQNCVKITLDATPRNDNNGAYFSIDSYGIKEDGTEEFSRLISIGDSPADAMSEGNYYLQTRDFKEPKDGKSGSGLRLNLSNGKLESYSEFIVNGNIRLNGSLRIGDEQKWIQDNNIVTVPSSAIEGTVNQIIQEKDLTFFTNNSNDYFLRASDVSLPREFPYENVVQVAKIGDTEIYAPTPQSVDLSNYYSKQEVDNMFNKLVSALRDLNVAIPDDWNSGN